MLVACSRCGKVHPRGQCAVPKPDFYKRTDTYERRFRSGSTWQRKRKEILERDNFLCRLCLYNGTLKQGELHVHHIIKVSANRDLKLVSDNLVTLCPQCHELVEDDPNYVDLLRTLAKSQPILRKPRNQLRVSLPIKNHEVTPVT